MIFFDHGLTALLDKTLEDARHNYDAQRVGFLVKTAINGFEQAYFIPISPPASFGPCWPLKTLLGIRALAITGNKAEHHPVNSVVYLAIIYNEVSEYLQSQLLFNFQAIVMLCVQRDIHTTRTVASHWCASHRRHPKMAQLTL